MARKTEKAETIDRHIGKCIRTQREYLGLTQAELAVAAGVSYQQIHKYEQGSNRISAGRLGLVAEILRLPVQHFYTHVFHPDTLSAFGTEKEDTRVAFEIARYFRNIQNPRLQDAVHQLLRTMAH